MTMKRLLKGLGCVLIWSAIATEERCGGLA